MHLDLEKAYDYLQTHNLVDCFIYNYENADSTYVARQSCISLSFLRSAFLWCETTEDHVFWNTHDDSIVALNINVSPIEVYRYIQQQQQQPQSYEYW